MVEAKLAIGGKKIHIYNGVKTFSVHGITNVQYQQNKSSETELVAHHFFNASNGEKFACNTKNGIVLEKNLHVLFHNMYGYRDNTLQQFQDFLYLLVQSQFKSTSSQGGSFLIISNKKLFQGSETRVLDSQLIKRLHEFLGELCTSLTKELFEEEII